MAKTVEERMAIVQGILGTGRTMVIAKTIKPGTLRNKVFGGSCTGYVFELGTLSYRGVWISTLEDISLTVDGAPVPKSDMLFRLGNITITVDNLIHHTDIFWGALDKAELIVNRIGGLTGGEHTFEISIYKRPDFGHSYGDGTEGYAEATEFHKPNVINDKAVLTV